MSETTIPSNHAETRLPSSPAPRMTAGDSQLLTPRSGGVRRELFPASWLRSPAKVVLAEPGEAGTLEGTLLDYCLTRLQKERKRESAQHQ